MKRAAIGFRMHSGWGALVAVSNEGAPEIIERKHVVVADAAIRGSKQPYHYAENLGLEKAEEHILKCSTASKQLASLAIGEILSELAKRGHQVESSAILMASGRTLPSLEKILASHALIHSAEGEFFRAIIRGACEEASLDVAAFRERDLDELVRKTFGKKANRIKQELSKCGKRLGPPWTQDEKLAALAASLALMS